MPHNLTLPQHRYIWVVSSFVLKEEEPARLIPAVWYGVSVTPDRMMGCHVVLENGAMVVDLPLHALRHTADASVKPVERHLIARWDMYGYDAEIFAPPYLVNTRVQALDTCHKPTVDYGRTWFAVDHLTDGYALEPGQHKHLWVVALDNTGVFRQLPQDQLLVHDWSFTEVDDVPPIKRQETIWRVE